MTTEATFRSDMTVELIRHMASDAAVVQAARVSTATDMTDTDETSAAGLINYLMSNRHGSPFEHSIFQWRVEAPIFVWREHMRHRIASYNEESGRYTQLKPVFYLPADDRNLQQIGKPGHYDFVPGTPAQVDVTRALHQRASLEAYEKYLVMLEAGVAKEVARMTLPVNIYSRAYVTMNARALMNFLSLRTKSKIAKFPSFPQREIEMVAEQYETAFEVAMPLTYAAFNAAGRVAP